MKTLLFFMVVPLLNLVVFAWFNRVALVRILALRQQLTVYKRKTKKPRLCSGPAAIGSYPSPMRDQREGTSVAQTTGLMRPGSPTGFSRTTTVGIKDRRVR